MGTTQSTPPYPPSRPSQASGPPPITPGVSPHKPPPSHAPSSDAGSALPVVLTVLGLVGLGVIVILAFFVWTTVGFIVDDLNPDNSPTIQRFEAEHPVMSDVTLETGIRTGYARSGGEAGFISLGYATGSIHIQEFEPAPGQTVDDVAGELVGLATAEGYDFVQRDGSWCSISVNGDQALLYPLEIRVVSVDPLPQAGEEFAPYVRLRVDARGC